MSLERAAEKEGEKRAEWLERLGRMDTRSSEGGVGRGGVVPESLAFTHPPTHHAHALTPSLHLCPLYTYLPLLIQLLTTRAFSRPFLATSVLSNHFSCSLLLHTDSCSEAKLCDRLT